MILLQTGNLLLPLCPLHAPLSPINTDKKKRQNETFRDTPGIPYTPIGIINNL